MVGTGSDRGVCLHLAPVCAGGMPRNRFALLQAPVEEVQIILPLLADRQERRLLQAHTVFPVEHLVHLFDADAWCGLETELTVLQVREGGDQEYEPERGGLERILEKPDRVPTADDPLAVEAVRVGGDAMSQHSLDELVYAQVGVIHVEVAVDQAGRHIAVLRVDDFRILTDRVIDVADRRDTVALDGDPGAVDFTGMYIDETAVRYCKFGRFIAKSNIDQGSA